MLVSGLRHTVCRSIGLVTSRKAHSRLGVVLTSLAMVGVLFAPMAQATTVWLDTSIGGAAGLGGGTATWDPGTTAVWTLDPTGGVIPSTYTSGADVIFNTTALTTVTVSGTVAANSLTFQSSFADTI